MGSMIWQPLRSESKWNSMRQRSRAFSERCAGLSEARKRLRVGIDHCPARSNPELAVDGFQVRAHCELADAQTIANLLGEQAVANELNDLKFPVCEQGANVADAAFAGLCVNGLAFRDERIPVCAELKVCHLVGPIHLARTCRAGHVPVAGYKVIDADDAAVPSIEHEIIDVATRVAVGRIAIGQVTGIGRAA
jgi:hypothetical protein